MKHHVVGENMDFEWENNKMDGRTWDQPVVDSLIFAIEFNEDFSIREGTLTPKKMKFLKLRIKEERKKVTDDYVEYIGAVTTFGQRIETCHRIYKDAFVEILTKKNGEKDEKKATITPELSDEEWKKIRGE